MSQQGLEAEAKEILMLTTRVAIQVRELEEIKMMMTIKGKIDNKILTLDMKMKTNIASTMLPEIDHIGHNIFEMMMMMNSVWSSTISQVIKGPKEEEEEICEFKANHQEIKAEMIISKKGNIVVKVDKDDNNMRVPIEAEVPKEVEVDHKIRKVDMDVKEKM